MQRYNKNFMCKQFFRFFLQQKPKKVIFAIKKPKIWHFVHLAV